MRVNARSLAVVRRVTALALSIWLVSAIAPARAQTTVPSPTPLPPLEALSETVERPLFLPDRRPPTAEEIEEAIEAAESGLFTLVGIIVSPTQRIALVRVRGSQEVLQLSEGQQANGWTVAHIYPQEVIFESNDKTETIELIDIKPPEPRRRPARERQPPAEQKREQ